MKDLVLDNDSLVSSFCVLYHGVILYKYKGWYYNRFIDLFGNVSFVRFGRI